MAFSLKKPNAEIYVPDGTEIGAALARTTHMAISAHQDDIEIMAVDGVLQCFGSPDRWFAGVVVTNGAGSARTGLYADYSDADMQKVRRVEQKKAAMIGEYGAMALLDHSSGETKNNGNDAVRDDLVALLLAASPEVVYTHNLADKHETHVATVVRVIQAIRRLPAGKRPKKVYGCEVWRNLDWMPDEDKTVFDVGGHESLSNALLGVFDSQICGGKRYDLATAGRRLANATYYASHAVDQSSALSYAMDLTPLIEEDDLSMTSFIQAEIDRFRDEVNAALAKALG